MIAIIPAAGLGTRFLPLTRAVPKEMLPIGNRPALELIVDEARRAGASRIVVIISERKELIREYFADADDVEFVYQREQRGLGHAVLQTAPLCEGEDRVLILLGDALVSGCLAGVEMADLSKRHDGASVIGAERVPMERVSRYGVLKVGDDLRISDLVEKPRREEAPSDIVIAGRYLLSTGVFDYLKTQTPGKGGEIQLTDAIRRMVVEGGRACYAYVYPGRRHDIGNPDGYFETLAAFRNSAIPSEPRTATAAIMI